ncbi:hypothetical protein AB0B30_27990 [Streptomyces narbonensis]|uniref:Uncharacterized protein n=1 Tax=Streptomyces narbonensis TaxID=67333 RepID=A0ABV3CDX6_9ACTN
MQSDEYYETMRQEMLASGLYTPDDVDMLVRAYRSRDEDFSAKEAEVGRPLLVHRMRRTNTTSITDCCKRSLDEPELKYDYVTHLVAKVTCEGRRGRAVPST